jgi:ferrochelatase
MTDRIGVVVMAYGTPASPDHVEAYYTHIRHGRPPTAEQLADLVRRYKAIGGTSPLARRTEAQRARLEGALDAAAPGTFEVVLGHKHAPPFVEDAAAALVGRVDRIVGVVLAPHYSRGSVGEYAARLAAASDAPAHTVESWHDLPALHAFHAAAVRAGLAALPARTKVLFTAHSLPERVLAGDRYEDELRASARAVADLAGLDSWAGWSIAWQSAARTPEPWRGPDVADVIRDLAATGRADAVLVCAHGFTSDHLEVLYDLDVLAAGIAGEAGLAFARTGSVNDDPGVFTALAERVVAAAG